MKAWEKREKVEKGLRACSQWGATEWECTESDCPYRHDVLRCVTNLHRDALEVLNMTQSEAGGEERPWK